uniref:Aminopeptidase n=1 Tax=Stomoxys calcitrans TaxID=35570 RepID=A0A1I8Q2F1_STOCA
MELVSALRQFFIGFLLFSFGDIVIKLTTAQHYRLSTDILPDFYDIAIKPYLQEGDGTKQFTFDGEVNITLHAEENNVSKITLHKAQLEILYVILYDSNGHLIERISIDRLQYEELTNKLTVPVTSPLVMNQKYTIYFKYNGYIRNDMAGVYRATYDGINWYLLTQLHRIDARTAFPCFDEPQLKATFQMRISRPKEYQSYFNTRLLRTTSDSDGRYTDYFEKSPRMSTYGVAFVVGDFLVEGSNDFKLIMHPKFKNKTNLTQEVAVKAIAAYDAYTQMSYKSMGNEIMQMLGVNRFPHSGMENWGLILYKDYLLAHEPHATDGWANKERTVGLVTHEVAHMWFGDSVTHKWWSYFWLNEAFPTYYQHFLTHEIYPEYELDKQFVLNEMHAIFDLDSTINTQPLTSPEESIQTPSEIGSKFSNLAYNKGASFVRMIANAMGKENFDKAMREYLKDNHLKNPAPEDLFKQWKQFWPAGHQVDLNQLFSDWTEQPGFPMIRIKAINSGRYLLEQQRFLLDAQDGSDTTLKYTIPITYTTNRERNFEQLTPKFYFNKSMTQLEFGDSNADEWIILNLQQSNYHRVFYETALLDKLRKAFMAPKHSDIHEINRAHMVDDLFTYGRIGLLGYDCIFEFMEYLAEETAYLPWHPAFRAFETISQRLTLSEHGKFGEFLFEILSKVYEHLGFHTNLKDSILDIYNRNKVITWLCKYHHRECNQKAQSYFQTSLATNVATDFQESLYCAACREGQYEIYLALTNLYKAETLDSQREKLMRAMGCTQHFVGNHLDFILGDNVKQEEKPEALANLYTQTPENVEPVYHLLTDSVEQLEIILGGWSSTANVISDIANYFTTQDQLDMHKQFIAAKGHLFGSSVSILENSIKTVEKNLLWSQKHLGKLFEYLDQRNGAISLRGLGSLVPLLLAVMVKLLFFIF